MKRILMILLVLAVSAHYAWSAPLPGPEPFGPDPMAFGPGPMPGPGPHRLHPLVKMAEDLGLGGEQKHAVALMLKNNRDTFHASGEALRAAMDALREAMDKEPFSEAAIREAHKAVAAAGEKMALLMAKERADFRALLTPEQRAAMDKMLAEFKAKRDRARLTTQAWIDQYGK